MNADFVRKVYLLKITKYLFVSPIYCGYREERLSSANLFKCYCQLSICSHSNQL